ncbi:hypothetical protein V6N11_020339 [Hibiscus sabdariffa]|uniref:Uncharacterized protein n=1 Tax=Hibiscus sabdariffa TaxID=183260 RepID=A0ABR2Q843_9ROSI
MVEQGGVEEIDHEVEGFTGRGNVVSKDIVKRGSTETHTVELQARVSRSWEQGIFSLFLSWPRLKSKGKKQASHLSSIQLPIAIIFTLKTVDRSFFYIQSQHTEALDLNAAEKFACNYVQEPFRK